MAPESKYIIVTDPSLITKPRTLSYYEFGRADNANVVICVHGLSRNGLDFEYLANALTDKYRVICPDIAGRGNSGWLLNKLDYNYTIYITDIIALMTQLRLSKVDWIGTSMGGIIGMMLAAGHPLLIKRLILNDIGSVVSGEGLKRIMGYVGVSSAFTSKDEAFAYLKSIIAPFGITSDSEWEYMFNASFYQQDTGGYALRYDPDISKPFAGASANAVQDIDLSAFWNLVRCPTLILRGENSDILSRQTATAMITGRAGVTLREIPKTGHAPALIHNEQVKIIRDWLDTGT